MRSTVRIAIAGLVAWAGFGSFDPAEAQQNCTITDVFVDVGQHQFPVPAGVSEIVVDALGARGGDIEIAPQNVGTGGLGAAALGAVITVTPGETIDVFVGGAGEDVLGNVPAPHGAGGFNGGGDGGAVLSAHGGGGGGGASDVRRGAQVLVIAGGGGGGAHGGFGGDGGQAGTDGTSVGTGDPNGFGRSGGSGGAPGVGSGNGAGGQAGSPGIGGDGGEGGDGGGGGGGGATGGGGGGGGTQTVGGGGGGGGGGSSDGPPGTSFQDGVQDGDGRVEISYEEPGCGEIDLAITKTTANVNPDNTVEFDLLAENFGPDDATGVVVTDDLPQCTVYQSDSCGGSAVGQQWTWTIGDLADQGSATCTLVVDATGCVGQGTQLNFVEIDGDQDDVNPGNNSDESDFEIDELVDLAITKTTETVHPDRTVDFSLVVENLGPDDATGVTATDTFPACTTFVSDDCGAAPGPPWTWTIGNLASGASATCTVTVDAAACAGDGPQTNIADVDGDQDDPNPDNNTDDSSFEIGEFMIDLAIDKTAALQADGTTVIFTLEVSNLGPDDGTGVFVNDELPQCTVYQSDDCGGTDGPPWTWGIGDLANGASASCNITVDAAGCIGEGPQTNTAEVTGNETDSNPDNNADDAVFEIAELMIDLAIEKTAAVQADGTTVIFTLEVSNLGPDDGTGVFVNDELPLCTVYQSDDCGGTDGPPWTWGIGDLANGASVSCNITVDAAGCIGEGPQTNTAEVTGTETDSNPDNNADDAAFEIAELMIDLAIEKTAAVQADGATVVFTLEASNLGPDDGTGVLVSDELPQCTVYQSDDCGGVDGSPWTWAIGDLANGASASCNITVDADGCLGEGSQTNTAEVTGNETDSNPDNNTDDADFAISEETVDLTLAKSAAVQGDGTTVVFTLAVNNVGPDDATGVSVTDELPQCTEYQSDDCGGADGPPWTWTIGDLASGGSASCDITVDATGCIGEGSQTNVAIVSGDQTDPTPGNNTDDADFEIADVPMLPLLAAFVLALLLSMGAMRMLRRVDA